MKQKILRFIQVGIIFVCLTTLSTCAFRGDVYVAFYWPVPATDNPLGGSTFQNVIPNIPNLGSLVQGGYYLTLPGTYAITYESNLSTIYNKTITLEAASAVGNETTLYDIILTDADGITVNKVPW